MQTPAVTVTLTPGCRGHTSQSIAGGRTSPHAHTGILLSSCESAVSSFLGEIIRAHFKALEWLHLISKELRGPWTLVPGEEAFSWAHPPGICLCAPKGRRGLRPRDSYCSPLPSLHLKIYSELIKRFQFRMSYGKMAFFHLSLLKITAKMQEE